MRVFVTGGTGLIGRRLVGRLIARGDTPVVLSRRADRARLNPALRGAEVVQGDPTTNGPWDAAVSGCDAAVNLAGQNLFARRWDAEVKRKIRDSRVLATENLVAALARADARPKVLVQGSAIGYYGPRGDEPLDEASKPGDDFMARVCVEWEQAARPAEGLGLRLATIRTGVVLARGEGALGVMTPIFRMGPGVPIGNGGSWWRPAGGQQFLSWVHVEDLVGLFLLALDEARAAGPINGTAPHPVRNAEFAREFSRALRRPATFWRFFLPFGPPDFALKLVLGEVADMVVTGQNVLPRKAQELGYAFRFPDLAGALADLFPRRRPAEGPKAKREEEVGAAR